MKNKDVLKLLAISLPLVVALGMTMPAYAGAMLIGVPPFDMAQVNDDGTIVDLEIWALDTVPDPAPSAGGYGVITGTNGGLPALAITTSHGGVCDSEDQMPWGPTPADCEGLWHQHHAVLLDESTIGAPGAASVPVDEPICDPTLTGTVFRVIHLSIESPGDVTPPGGTEHISFWGAPRSEPGTDAIASIPGFPFGPAELPTPTYPTVAFDIWVNPDLGLDPLGVPVINPATGLREVCVYNVLFVEAPNDPKVGGEFLGINTAALLIAGFQASAIWMIPTIAGIAATGIYLTKFRANKQD